MKADATTGEKNLQKKRLRSESFEYKDSDQFKKSDKRDIQIAQKPETSEKSNAHRLDACDTENDLTKTNSQTLEKTAKDTTTFKQQGKSNCLLIVNLQRPFPLLEFQSLLKQNGKFKRLWMDNIRTHCYVEYRSSDEAFETQKQLNGLVWPKNGKTLKVDFSSKAEVSYAIENNQSPYTTGIRLNFLIDSVNANSNVTATTDSKKETLKKELQSSTPDNDLLKVNEIVSEGDLLENKLDSVSLTNNIGLQIDNDRNKQEKVEMIEKSVVKTLFQKTVTKPHVYYCSVSEEEVEEKKRKLREQREQKEQSVKVSKDVKDAKITK